MMFERNRPPEELVDFAHLCEDAGAEELWLVEDLGWAGGIAAAATALAVTERITVGIGICPAPLRNPALLAMELALLARLHPGRLIPGLGHGVRSWMRRVGVAPASPLALLSESVSAVRDLLAGRTVVVEGREVHLDDITLTHPPHVPPPVVTGVTGPRSLELSGRFADGTVLIEGTGPALLDEARAHIDRGREAAGRTDHHRIVVFMGAYVSTDSDAAAAVRSLAVREMSDYLGKPDDEVFIAVGPADHVAGQVHALWEAGADSVVLRPLGTDLAEQTRLCLAALGRTP